MGKRPRRRIVLVLVEGKSDREALQIAISELYEKIDENVEVFFPIIRRETEERGGDITTSLYTDKRNKTKWVSPDNIEDAIYRLFLEDFFDEMKIMPKDVSEIIQVVDMDGAYISDEHVVLAPDLSEDNSTYYSDTNIACLDVERIIRRNQQKRANLDFLVTKDSIKVKTKTVPYSVYYFSSNLDHFLFNDANLDYRRKRLSADEFSKMFIGNVDGFVKTISEDESAASEMTYEESWENIREGLNSLQRHTNINILLKRISDENCEQ